MRTSRARDGSLHQKAYAFIQQQILAGRLTAGTAISEVALARQIGVSRTPVREAIGQLVAEGFLERIPGRGVVVVQPTREDLIELYELREALEVYAVGKVARHRPSSAELGVLREACDEIRRMADRLRHSGRERLNDAEMQAFLATDLKFHMLLLRLAGNRRIMKVVADTRLLTRIFSYRREGHDAGQLESIHRYHSQVLDAVQAGDPELAMERLREHIHVSRQERLEAYDRWEREHELQRVVPLPAALLQPAETAQPLSRAERQSRKRLPVRVPANT
ncbi:MAG: GntR family transcriptional regulator [Bryobacterales bacterium]|nr:GntR family transcriptional regulator [Bryobacteraceae bacterium]MDW8131850.1 GntR family transcriptional regulator [Bryobacterales bacterium]